MAAASSVQTQEGVKWKLNQVFGEDPSAVNEGIVQFERQQ